MCAGYALSPPPPASPPCMRVRPPHLSRQVYAILDEYIVAGELQETSHAVILDRLKELEKAMM